MRAGILIALTAVAGVAVAADLNYDELIPLDAEALAETGLKPAYEELHAICLESCSLFLVNRVFVQSPSPPDYLCSSEEGDPFEPKRNWGALRHHTYIT